MRKYSLYLVLSSLFCAGLAQAEFKFGALLGGNFTTFRGGGDRTVDLGGAPPTEYSGSLNAAGDFGYQLGGIVRYDQPTWSIDINAIYATRSLKVHGTLSNGTNDVRNSLEYSFHQIEIPLIGFYKIPQGKMTYRFGLGLNGTYGIGKVKLKDRYSNVPGSVASTSHDYDWNVIGFNKFNVGGLVAFGSDINLGTSKLGLELRGQSSFTNYADTINPNFSGSSLGILSIDLLVSFVF